LRHYWTLPGTVFQETADAMSGSRPFLEFDKISKAFFGVRVLKDVSFKLHAGRTLGLVGENGAGKSTLMNILGGNLQPDGGEMRLEGRIYAPRHPQDAAGQGIAFIHQELNLFGNLSVAENLFITSFPRGFRGLPLIDHAAMRRRSSALLSQVGLDLSPDTLVENLSAGERQLVEVAKAISAEARAIILDEPTTSLTAPEAEHLFGLMRQLRSRGVTMIYISHNLGDVLRLCDEAVILRDGEVAGCGAAAEFSLERMISLMVGRTLNQMFPERTGAPGEQAVLEVLSVTQPGIAKEISFTLRKGEVLGLSGLMGSGRSELARLIFGLDSFQSGEILLAGRQLKRHEPREVIRQGLAFVTENRREEGLCMEAAISENIALVTLPEVTRTPLRLVDRWKLREAVGRIRKAIRLTSSARDEQPVRTLSGGNQQKVVLAKWLLARPSVLILDEPTRGIDVGAKMEIYRLINDLASGGAGILLISSELEELIGLCDRILVMSRGEIRDELRRSDFDRERMLRSALHDRPGDCAVQ
jgi:ribose transport system ATP-binding protein